jgi:hypothetical protein
MATKTISIDLEAYERLDAARRHPKESFSKVIKRAQWSAPPRTARALLERGRTLPAVDEATLERLDRAQRQDLPPESAWDD